RILDPDLPIADTRIDNLEAGHDPFGGAQHIGHGYAGAGQILLEHKGNLAFSLGLDQGGHVHALALVDHHAIGEHAEVRLIDLEQVHHRLAGHADLLADDAFAI